MKKIAIVAICLIVVLLVSIPVVSSITNNNLPRQIEIGNKYLLEGDYEEAILAFDKAIKIDPLNIDAHIGLAKAFKESGRPEEAKNPLNTVIEIDKENVEAYLLLVEVYVDLQELENAYYIIDLGIETTNDPELYLALAELYLSEGNIEGAIFALDEGLYLTDSPVLEERLEKIRPSAPVANIKSGEYTEPIMLELKSSIEGWEVYYNVNGTNDQMINKYEKPIIIDKETVINAISRSANGASSKVLTSVYSIQKAEQSDSDYLQMQGNTLGNIANDGFAAIDSDWIYYLTNAYYGELFKIKKDGSENTKILDLAYHDINVVDGWIFYAGNFLADGIYKVRTDGSDQELLLDGLFCYGLMVVDDWIYFFSNNENEGLYRMKTDGSDLERITSDGNMKFLVVDDWIYFSEDDYYRGGSFYKIRTNGSEKTLLSDTFATWFCIYNDYIYYSDYEDNGCLYRIKTDGSAKIKITEFEVSGINVSEGLVYCVLNDYGNDEGVDAICTIKEDGSVMVLLETDKDISSLNVVDDWIFYPLWERWTDDEVDGDFGRFYDHWMYKVRKDGSENTLVSYDYPQEVFMP